MIVIDSIELIDVRINKSLLDKMKSQMFKMHNKKKESKNIFLFRFANENANENMSILSIQSNVTRTCQFKVLKQRNCTSSSLLEKPRTTPTKTTIVKE